MAGLWTVVDGLFYLSCDVCTYGETFINVETTVKHTRRLNILHFSESQCTAVGTAEEKG